MRLSITPPPADRVQGTAKRQGGTAAKANQKGGVKGGGPERERPNGPGVRQMKRRETPPTDLGGLGGIMW
jgi:hypothetical protein